MRECHNGEDSGACLSVSCKELDRSPILLIRYREFAISVCNGCRNSQRLDFGAEIDRSLKMNLVLNCKTVTMRFSRVINIVHQCTYLEFYHH